ncbi:MAG: hypothetical protein U0744_09320 [Gemmataceae bacterium]
MVRPLFAIAFVAYFSASLSAQEAADTRVVSVGLFKNGLTLVKREVKISKEGYYRLDDPIELIHGTYWVETDTPIETRVQECDVEPTKPTTFGADLQTELAGRSVVVHFKNEKRTSIQGKMAELQPQKIRSLSDSGGGISLASRIPGKYLLVQGERKLYYIDPTEIASVEADDAAAKAKKKEPRLVLSVAEGQVPKSGKVIVRYLTKGLSWAASYQIDVSDPKMMHIRQGAAIRNEWASIRDAEVYLITGSAGVKYAGHWSPLTPSINWAMFMAGVAGHGMFGTPGHAIANHAMVSNTMVTNFDTRVARGGEADAANADISPLYYHPIGKRTLPEGEAMAVNVVDAKIGYERVAEWLIPANQGGQPQTAENQEVWEGLRFKNPFDFPLTGAPAMMMNRDQFLGQQFLQYVVPGETEFLKVNRALSVRTRHDEVREPKVENVIVGAWSYEKVLFQSAFVVRNLRKDPLKIIVRRSVHGELLSTEGDPRKLGRNDTASDVNTHQELVWDLTIPASETRTINYRYAHLFRR